MWWLSPNDSETFAIDDQFAVGDDMIVAPVVQKGALSRTVYLPSGSWREYGSNAVISGGQRITVDAPLDKLPVFIRA
jgi:alpha-glucosidase (family GH31 glycosyl hydrolase)